MNIDWSKAPEWANAVIKAKTGNLVWVPFADGICIGLMVEGGYPQEVDMVPPHEWKLVEVRPTEPWNGEGLPPVGTVCEFAGFNPEETMPTDPRVGDQVTVIAHFMSGSFEVAAFTFYAPPEFEYLQVAQGAYGCFRPIRTPKQIAAEERLAAINYMEIDAGMCATAFDGDPEARAWIENLIDKGWRKPVSE